MPAESSARPDERDARGEPVERLERRQPKAQHGARRAA